MPPTRELVCGIVAAVFVRSPSSIRARIDQAQVADDVLQGAGLLRAISACVVVGAMLLVFTGCDNVPQTDGRARLTDEQFEFVRMLVLDGGSGSGEARVRFLLSVDGRDLSREEYRRLSSKAISVVPGSRHKPGTYPMVVDVKMKSLSVGGDEARLLFWRVFDGFYAQHFVARFEKVDGEWSIVAVEQM